MDPATASFAIKGVSSLLGATGAVGGGATVPSNNATSASPYNSSGSVYTLTSGGGNDSPLISQGLFGGLNNTKLLIIGGLGLLGFLLFKKVI
jgi:hypothetical protein